ncbi:hypothetical protein FRX31_009736 [Thalictrum thalictroides]|uniref:Uncharacterized protein n=1 Tax=Thalictrum thalictroides TaxID=46969 RepID=A0A7J6WUU6_THATH|nr:hypothetical protein FRX31_009736 [Thalictrum thalictroides]
MSGYDSEDEGLVEHDGGMVRVVNSRYVNNYPEVRSSYGLTAIPNLEIRFPQVDLLSPSYSPNNPYSVVFTLMQFRAGLRLPLSDLVVELLNTIRRAPCQMNGNFWRNMRVIDLLNQNNEYQITVADVLGTPEEEGTPVVDELPAGTPMDALAGPPVADK